MGRKMRNNSKPHEEVSQVLFKDDVFENALENLPQRHRVHVSKKSLAVAELRLRPLLWDLRTLPEVEALLAHTRTL